MPDGQVHVQVSYAELSQLQWKLGYIPKQGRGSGLELQHRVKGVVRREQ